MAEPGDSDLPPAVGCPLLILYGSETGTAQEAAERISREARARHWLPRVLPCDSAQVVPLLPRAGRVVFSVATAGQGEFPPNARSLWRFLARASLPADCLSGLRVAVFGFGDSGYPLFNAAARKLHRRLVEGLGATPLVPLGLGDDSAAAAASSQQGGSKGGGVGVGGPDAALDAWLRELWPALRKTTQPLPPGVPEGEEGWSGGKDEVARLGPCRFSVDVVERGDASSSCSSSPSSPPSSSSSLDDVLPSREEALEAHAAFARLDAASAGEASAPPGYELKTTTTSSTLTTATATTTTSSGPAFPLSAVVAENRRMTPESHWQDTRHLTLRITNREEEAAATAGKATEEPSTSSSPPPLYYSPGDVAAFLPEQSRASVALVLSSSGLNPRDRVRVSAAAADSPLSALSHSSPPPPHPSLSFETTAAALVAGVLELDGASPRRRLFEVLAAFCGKRAAAEEEREEKEEEEEEKEQEEAAAKKQVSKSKSPSSVPASLAAERLSHFASPEGRPDVDLYCRSESRTLAEVLSDFPVAARETPLAWLLSSAPRLRPRHFSIASAPGVVDGNASSSSSSPSSSSSSPSPSSSSSSPSSGNLDLTVAVVDYHSPHGRHKVGLASGWLSRLESAAGSGSGSGGDRSCRLPLWIERGALSLPALVAAAARQQQRGEGRICPSSSPLDAWLSTPLILIGPGTGIAPMRSLLQFRREEIRKRKGSAAASSAASFVAPCSLYFGCRSPSADCYYRPEFEAMVADGTLERYRVAFSREADEEDGKARKKTYVTHLLREDADALWRLLCPPSSSSSSPSVSSCSSLPLPASVVVAGSAKNMPRDVQLAFEDIAAERGGLGKEAARAFVRKMVSGQRYFVEAWS